MPALVCDQISFEYPGATAPVLSDVSLFFKPGSFTALLGPNGAGKSTLLRLLAGLLPPATGNIRLDGRDLSSLRDPERARLLAYLPQSVHFAFPVTARECVEMGRYSYAGLLGRLSPEDRKCCDRALEYCDAASLADRSLDSLSGGERQRVLLASALAQSPKVLLLDEPTLSLDLPHREGFFRVVRQLHRREGLSVVVATHELDLAARTADRLVLLSRGRVDCEGGASKVLSSARVTRVFGIKVQRLRGPQGSLHLIPDNPAEARR